MNPRNLTTQTYDDLLYVDLTYPLVYWEPRLQHFETKKKDSKICKFWIEFLPPSTWIIFGQKVVHLCENFQKNFLILQRQKTSFCCMFLKQVEGEGSIRFIFEVTKWLIFWRNSCSFFNCSLAIRIYFSLGKIMQRIIYQQKLCFFGFSTFF